MVAVAVMSYLHFRVGTCWRQPLATLTPQSDLLDHPPLREKGDNWAEPANTGLLQEGEMFMPVGLT